MWINRQLTGLAAACALAALALVARNTMAEPPEDARSGFLIAGSDGTTPPLPPVTTPRTYVYWYDGVVDRWRILEDNGTILDIPTLAAESSFELLMLDGNGQLAGGGLHIPSSFPWQAQWPQVGTPAPWTGQVLGVNAAATPDQLVHQTVPHVLASVSVDLNVTTKTALYTVPTGYEAVITGFVVRKASTSLTTAQFSFGFNATADDVVGIDLYNELTSSTRQTQASPKAGAEIGGAGAVLGLKCSTAQGAAATVTVDVIGYLVPA